MRLSSTFNWTSSQTLHPITAMVNPNINNSLWICPTVKWFCRVKINTSTTSSWLELGEPHISSSRAALTSLPSMPSRQALTSSTQHSRSWSSETSSLQYKRSSSWHEIYYEIFHLSFRWYDYVLLVVSCSFSSCKFTFGAMILLSNYLLRGHNWQHFAHRPQCIVTLNSNFAIFKTWNCFQLE